MPDMLCSKEAIFRFADAFFLSGVFLFQSVILNYFIIRHFIVSVTPFLWFLADFFCLLVFSYTLFLSYRGNYKRKRREKLSNLSHSNSLASTPRSHSRNSDNGSVGLFTQLSNLPFSYISWILFSVILIAKIVTLFKSDIPQSLHKEDFFGPQLIKFAIGCTALLFTLLVEAHHDAHNEPVRNAYIKAISYSTALEILDSVSFLTLLIGSESHLIYTYKFENFIISLSSLNLMLPAVTLYKLTVSNFGKTYPVPLETLYKILHLVLVNVPYLGVRLYLWRWFSTDTSIFIIKNIYSIIIFLRDIFPDILKLESYCENRKQNRVSGAERNSNKDLPSSLNGNSIHFNGKSKNKRNFDEEVPFKLQTIGSTLRSSEENHSSQL